MPASTSLYTVNKTTAEIKIYGYIVDDEDSSWDQFQTDFNQVANNNSEATIRINSGGGEMVKGLAMYDSIRGSKCKFTGIVEGMAASMAGPLFMACYPRIINKHARVMLHRPQGKYQGEAEGFEAYATQMKQEEDKLVAIYVERTGQPEAVVKTWFIPGAEKWFNSADALKYGIATEIAEHVTDIKRLQNITGSIEDMIGIYNVILNEENKLEFNIMNKEVLGVLNAYKVSHTLTDQSTDKQLADVVEVALKAQKDQIDELNNKLKVQNDTVIENALVEAIDDGKITADKKEDWRGILVNNFEVGSRTLKSLSPAVDVNNVLKPGENKTTGSTVPGNRKEWTARDWEQKDEKGWNKMKLENKAEFDRISEDFYGKGE